MKLKQVPEELSTVDLLIVLLLRFPEIFTIKYNLPETKFELSFMLKSNPEKSRYIKFKESFDEAAKAYNELAKLKTAVPKLSRKFIDSWVLLQVTWKKDNITFEEVNLINQIISNEFKNDLVLDSRVDEPLEKDLSFKEEFIEFLLSRKNEKNEENLFAFREAGKVYVFDR
ncbi:MAG: hypothetical protein GXZ07_06720 [Firmicutes bacterium]|nr:hypothetical protein [Bacillota bacterium]